MTSIRRTLQVVPSATQLQPYRIAAGLALSRLRWDLRPVAWTSRRRMQRLRRCGKDGKAVIVCNGPSLTKVDFSAISGLYTIGMNKINLLFDRSPFRPSCIACVDRLVIEQNARFFNATTLPLFIGHAGVKWLTPRPNVTFLHESAYPMVVGDLSCSMYTGHTVTFVALQLAYHFGFRDVAIVGCDHNFATAGEPGERVVSNGSEPSHFDMRYYEAGQAWDLPDYVGMEYAYMLAKRLYSRNGGRVVNCTVGGRLECFPRMRLAEWLDDVRAPANGQLQLS